MAHRSRTRRHGTQSERGGGPEQTAGAKKRIGRGVPQIGERWEEEDAGPREEQTRLIC